MPGIERPPARTPVRAPGRASGSRDARGPARPSAWRLLLRRQRWLIRPAAWTALGLAVVAGGVLTVRTVQPGSALARMREAIGASTDLRVAEVVIEGRSNTPEAQLRTALNVKPGDLLLGFSLEAARARIEALTWVQSASVERRMPGTVVVNLTERRPFAVWQRDNRFVLIDRAGQVVAEQDPVKDQAAFGVLPLVVGVGAPDHAAELLDALAQYPLLKQRVVAAVRVGERRWNLRLNTGADVMLPEGHIAVAMGRLMEFQQAQGVLDRPLSVLDLRLPDRFTLRPQPEPRTPPPSAQRRPT